MTKHTHDFVNTYDGLEGFGLDRATDENSLKMLLQKFSDDEFLARFVPRLSEDEINALVDVVYDLLRRHLSEEEYHTLFLKEPD